jgi:hypothetical protein
MPSALGEGWGVFPLPSFLFVERKEELRNAFKKV